MVFNTNMGGRDVEFVTDLGMRQQLSSNRIDGAHAGIRSLALDCCVAMLLCMFAFSSFPLHTCVLVCGIHYLSIDAVGVSRDSLETERVYVHE